MLSSGTALLAYALAQAVLLVTALSYPRMTKGTRLANGIRVGSTAQLSGFDLALNPRRRAMPDFVVNDLFP